MIVLSCDYLVLYLSCYVLVLKITLHCVGKPHHPSTQSEGETRQDNSRHPPTQSEQYSRVLALVFVLVRVSRV